jgi:hypothetical protein
MNAAKRNRFIKSQEKKALSAPLLRPINMDELVEEVNGLFKGKWSDYILEQTRDVNMVSQRDEGRKWADNSFKLGYVKLCSGEEIRSFVTKMVNG